MNMYYSSSTNQTYTPAQMLNLFGINTETASDDFLNANGFYMVVESNINGDTYLYSASPVYTVSGSYAYQDWVYTPRPLNIAKNNGTTQVKQQAADKIDNFVLGAGYTIGIMTSVASQDLADRPAKFQEVLAEMEAVTNQLSTNIDSIQAATSVDEINNIVNPPTGTLFTGRGSGLGPEDLNISYYTAFSSLSMTESETELYVPGTSTVIPYTAGQFDSLGNCFLPGDYLIQIRETATSRVIAEFEVPLNPAGENVSF